LLFGEHPGVDLDVGDLDRPPGAHADEPARERHVVALGGDRSCAQRQFVAEDPMRQRSSERSAAYLANASSTSHSQTASDCIGRRRTRFRAP
jgi:hypothetical protein